MTWLERLELRLQLELQILEAQQRELDARLEGLVLSLVLALTR